MAKNVKTVLIPIVVVIVAAGVAYGAGRWQGKQQTQQVQAELDETRTNLQAELQQTKSALNACEDKADRLEARRRIHMALEELAALNFGYAQKHLRAAGNILAEASTDDPKLAKLAKELKTMEIEPAGQLDQQRTHVNRLAHRFDTLVPPAEK